MPWRDCECTNWGMRTLHSHKTCFLTNRLMPQRGSHLEYVSFRALQLSLGSAIGPALFVYLERTFRITYRSVLSGSHSLLDRFFKTARAQKTVCSRMVQFVTILHVVRYHFWSSAEILTARDSSYKNWFFFCFQGYTESQKGKHGLAKWSYTCFSDIL